MQTTTAAKQDLTQTLVDRARAMLPALRERAASCESECKVPDATIADFQEAGFFKILQPRRWGGYELDPQSFYAVQMTLAEACMSSAWVLGVVACTTGSSPCSIRRPRPTCGAMTRPS